MNHGNNAKVHESFRKFAHAASLFVGSPWMFVAACCVIVGWAITGPLFHYSDTWQLVINTATTIVTFLMVFLIQNTQNRDARAMHLKLDELIRVMKGARSRLLNLEEMSDEELDQLHAEFERVRGQRRGGDKPRSHKHHEPPMNHREREPRPHDSAPGPQPSGAA